jgi:hypothetical protein
MTLELLMTIALLCQRSPATGASVITTSAPQQSECQIKMIECVNKNTKETWLANRVELCVKKGLTK